ncbi:hypothetical protein J5N97_017403 [Dioscorea zingiberensis]|uniref:Uncharacterized protein n=1 Tax=Dioscorea zingiberensis TaxID=325984 RepID=A0A9D5HGI1_9LILI|nr:hypothetical protein J5N97_017403 [Dioscorea zingiberensis]
MVFATEGGSPGVSKGFLRIGGARPSSKLLLLLLKGLFVGHQGLRAKACGTCIYVFYQYLVANHGFDFVVDLNNVIFKT